MTVEARPKRYPDWARDYARSLGLSVPEATAYAIRSTPNFGEAAKAMGVSRATFARFRAAFDVKVDRVVPGH